MKGVCVWVWLVGWTGLDWLQTGVFAATPPRVVQTAKTVEKEPVLLPSDALTGRESQWIKTIQQILQEKQTTSVLLQTDKPMYYPGEYVWGRSVEIILRGNRLPTVEQRAVVRLVDAKNQRFWQKTIRVLHGHSSFHLILPQNLQRGWYRLQYANLMTREFAQRRIQVEVGESPRPKAEIRWSLPEFRPGQKVQAALVLQEASGKTLLGRTLRCELRCGKKRLRQWSVRTDRRGEVWLSFAGTTPCMREVFSLHLSFHHAGKLVQQKVLVPVSAVDLDVQFFPEGGHAVEGLPASVYFVANTLPNHLPANIEGVLEDEQGKTVTTIRSVLHGMGRFRYTPQKGHSYRLRIVQPWGVAQRFSLPPAKKRGISLQLMKSTPKNRDALLMTVSSHTMRRIVAVAVQHDEMVGYGAFLLQPGTQRVRLPLVSHRRGVVRLTLFDQNQQPLAERLSFLLPQQENLRVSIKIDKTTVALRQTVKGKIRVTDQRGRPVHRVRLGVVVVDKKAVDAQDPYLPGWLAQRYFPTKELKGWIYRPNVYWDSTLPRMGIHRETGFDLVMGVHGWRQFSQRILRENAPSLWNIGVHQLHQEAQRKQKWRSLSIPTEQEWQDSLSGFETTPFLLVARMWKQRIVGQKDTDSDGVPDEWDRCPDIPGPHHEQGCPWLDQDKDGVPDVIDKCPYESGPAWRDGCPVAQNAPHLSGKSVDAAEKGIKISIKIPFSTGSTRFSAQLRLHQLAKLMKMYPGLSIYVDGHVNNQKGPSLATLAKSRAETIQRALIRLGVSPNRLAIRVKKNRENAHLGETIGVDYISFEVKSWLRLPWWFRVENVREFPVRYYPRSAGTSRTDWRETLYWHPDMVTDKNGEVGVSFGVGDRVSTFQLQVDAAGAGQISTGQQTFQTSLPITGTLSWPDTLTVQDQVILPFQLVNHLSTPVELRCELTWDTSVLQQREKPASQPLVLPAHGQQTLLFSMQAIRSTSRTGVIVICRSVFGEMRWEHTWSIRPQGFVHSHLVSGMLLPEQPYSLSFSAHNQEAGIRASGNLVLFSSLMSQMSCCVGTTVGWGKSGSVFLGPHDKYIFSDFASHIPLDGPFPGAMAVVSKPTAYAVAQAKLLRQLYEKYLFWEKILADPTLSKRWESQQESDVFFASVLLWLVEMKRHENIPDFLIKRVRAWLLAKRDGQGSFLRHSLGGHRHSVYALVVHAYLVYALAESGYKHIEPELRWLQTRIDSHRDPHLWALALKSWIHVYGAKHPQALKWTHLLWQHRQTHGGYDGTTTSVSHATGRELHIQTTALAIQALVLSHLPPVILQPSLFWLQSQRSLRGFGTPLSTFLAHQAILRMHQKTQPALAKGHIHLWLQQKDLGQYTYDGGLLEPKQITSWLPKIQPGTNTLRVLVRGDAALPFSFWLRHATEKPPLSGEHAPLRLNLSIRRTTVQQGQQVSLHVSIKNRTSIGITAILVQLHIPAGLRISSAHIQSLVKTKTISAWNQQGQSMLLFLDHLLGHTQKDITLLGSATHIGRFSTQSSSVYSYQNPQGKAWSTPLQLVVVPKQ